MPRDRDDRAAHLRLVDQDSQRLQIQQQIEQQLAESDTVLAYRNGMAFGRQLGWQQARTWWLGTGGVIGFLAGVAAVLLTHRYLSVPMVW